MGLRNSNPLASDPGINYQLRSMNKLRPEKSTNNDDSKGNDLTRSLMCPHILHPGVNMPHGCIGAVNPDAEELVLRPRAA